MTKYWSIFKISFQQEFAYRFSFILWRLRNIIQILIFFFLWDAVFSTTNTQVLGYSKDQIFTYAFVLILIRAIVFSTRSNDIAGQVAGGELTNLLLKPVNYFKYWIARDITYKSLNIIFGTLEAVVLIIILKPNLFIQANPIYIGLFIWALIVAMVIYFLIVLITSFVPFWVPEIAWGAQFLVTVIIAEFLSGSAFPIDVLPNILYRILLFTPFPYLIFIPIKIYLGDLSYPDVIQSLVIGTAWCFILWKMASLVWKKGLRIYEGVGR